MNKKALKAFTLAEVLITLTIIGVIAAITIQNLIQSYKKHQVETGLKEAYSILSNALTMARSEYGEHEDMIADSIANKGNNSNNWTPYFSEKYIEPYIKFSRKCTIGGNLCSPIFTNTYIKAINDDWAGGLNGWWDTRAWQKLILANGMYLGIIGITSDKSVRFIVDINGNNGPNRSGTDIFYFTFDENYKLIGGSGFEKYVGKYSCSNSVGGADCSAIIQRNGWKIPDNYPVKKW